MIGWVGKLIPDRVTLFRLCKRPHTESLTESEPCYFVPLRCSHVSSTWLCSWDGWLCACNANLNEVQYWATHVWTDLSNCPSAWLLLRLKRSRLAGVCLQALASGPQSQIKLKILVGKAVRKTLSFKVRLDHLYFYITSLQSWAYHTQPRCIGKYWCVMMTILVARWLEFTWLINQTESCPAD